LSTTIGADVGLVRIDGEELDALLRVVGRDGGERLVVRGGTGLERPEVQHDDFAAQVLQRLRSPADVGQRDGRIRLAADLEGRLVLLLVVLLLVVLRLRRRRFAAALLRQRRSPDEARGGEDGQHDCDSAHVRLQERRGVRMEMGGMGSE